MRDCDCIYYTKENMELCIAVCFILQKKLNFARKKKSFEECAFSVFYNSCESFCGRPLRQSPESPWHTLLVSLFLLQINFIVTHGFTRNYSVHHSLVLDNLFNCSNLYHYLIILKKED